MFLPGFLYVTDLIEAYHIIYHVHFTFRLIYKNSRMPKFRNIRRNKRRFFGNQHEKPGNSKTVNIQDVNSSLVPVNIQDNVNSSPVPVNSPEIQNNDSSFLMNASFTSTASFRKLSDNTINEAERILDTPQKIRQERKKNKMKVSGISFYLHLCPSICILVCFDVYQYNLSNRFQILKSIFRTSPLPLKLFVHSLWLVPIKISILLNKVDLLRSIYNTMILM